MKGQRQENSAALPVPAALPPPQPPLPYGGTPSSGFPGYRIAVPPAHLTYSGPFTHTPTGFPGTPADQSPYLPSGAATVPAAGTSPALWRRHSVGTVVSGPVHQRVAEMQGHKRSPQASQRGGRRGGRQMPRTYSNGSDDVDSAGTPLDTLPESGAYSSQAYLSHALPRQTQARLWLQGQGQWYSTPQDSGYGYAFPPGTPSGSTWATPPVPDRPGSPQLHISPAHPSAYMYRWTGVAGDMYGPPMWGYPSELAGHTAPGGLSPSPAAVQTPNSSPQSIESYPQTRGRDWSAGRGLRGESATGAGVFLSPGSFMPGHMRTPVNMRRSRSSTDGAIELGSRESQHYLGGGHGTPVGSHSMPMPLQVSYSNGVAAPGPPSQWMGRVDLADERTSWPASTPGRDRSFSECGPSPGKPLFSPQIQQSPLAEGEIGLSTPMSTLSIDSRRDSGDDRSYHSPFSGPRRPRMGSDIGSLDAATPHRSPHSVGQTGSDPVQSPSRFSERSVDSMTGDSAISPHGVSHYRGGITGVAQELHYSDEPTPSTFRRRHTLSSPQNIQQEVFYNGMVAGGVYPYPQYPYYDAEQFYHPTPQAPARGPPQAVQGTRPWPTTEQAAAAAAAAAASMTPGGRVSAMSFPWGLPPRSMAGYSPATTTPVHKGGKKGSPRRRSWVAGSRQSRNDRAHQRRGSAGPLPSNPKAAATTPPGSRAFPPPHPSSSAASAILSPGVPRSGGLQVVTEARDDASGKR